MTAGGRLGNATALENPHDDRHEGDDEQDVDESAQRVGGHQSEEPKDDQNKGKCLEHGGSGSEGGTAHFVARP